MQPMTKFDNYFSLSLSGLSFIVGVALTIHIQCVLRKTLETRPIAVRVPALVFSILLTIGWFLILSCPLMSLRCRIPRINFDFAINAFVAIIFLIGFVPLLTLEITRIWILRVQYRVAEIRRQNQLGEIDWISMSSNCDVRCYSDECMSKRNLSKFNSVIDLLLIGLGVAATFLSSFGQNGRTRYVPHFKGHSTSGSSQIALLIAYLFLLETIFFIVSIPIAVSLWSFRDNFRIRNELYATIGVMFVGYVVEIGFFYYYSFDLSASTLPRLILIEVLTRGFVAYIHTYYLVASYLSSTRTPSLCDLLSSYRGFKSFLEFLVTELSVENLEFLQLSMRWRNYIFHMNHPRNVIDVQSEIGSVEFLFETAKSDCSEENGDFHLELANEVQKRRAEQHPLRWPFTIPCMTFDYLAKIPGGPREMSTSVTHAWNDDFSRTRVSVTDTLGYESDDIDHFARSIAAYPSTDAFSAPQKSQSPAGPVPSRNGKTFGRSKTNVASPRRSFVAQSLVLAPIRENSKLMEDSEISLVPTLSGNPSPGISSTSTSLAIHPDLSMNNAPSVSVLDLNSMRIDMHAKVDEEVRKRNEHQTPDYSIASHTFDPEFKPPRSVRQVSQNRSQKGDRDRHSLIDQDELQCIHDQYTTREPSPGISMGGHRSRSATQSKRRSQSKDLELTFSQIGPDFHQDEVPANDIENSVTFSVASSPRSRKQPFQGLMSILEQTLPDANSSKASSKRSSFSTLSQFSYMKAWLSPQQAKDKQKKRARIMVSSKHLSWQRLKRCVKDINIGYEANIALKQFFTDYPQASDVTKNQLKVDEYDHAMHGAWQHVWDNLRDSLSRYATSKYYTDYLANEGAHG